MLARRTHIVTSFIVLDLFIMVITFRLLFSVGPGAAFVWLLFLLVFARVVRRHRIRKQERLKAHEH